MACALCALSKHTLGEASDGNGSVVRAAAASALAGRLAGWLTGLTRE